MTLKITLKSPTTMKYLPYLNIVVFFLFFKARRNIIEKTFRYSTDISESFFGSERRNFSGYQNLPCNMFACKKYFLDITFRIYAYRINPRRTKGVYSTFPGGRVYRRQVVVATPSSLFTVNTYST